ncbi:MAG: peptidyl-prolyl cis-trans isomerase [Granulosicoccus sp.]|nr:peptidyl-prolyl cis-trans isomerase [Granulosicoccus sp.]
MVSPTWLRKAVRAVGLGVICLSCTLTAWSDDTARPQVVISTSMGDLVVELEQERAPQTVENFLQYVDDGFYEQTLFHRVIEGFMIQGGGFSTQYQRKTTRPPVSNEAYNELSNLRYTIAMARTNAPHSATSQFFINSVDNINLDHTDTSQRGWGYTVFGKVIKGQDVVDAISRVRTGSGGPFSRDVPAEPVVILNVDRVASVPVAQPAANIPAPGNTMGSPADAPKSIKTDLDPKRPQAIQSMPVEQN